LTLQKFWFHNDYVIVEARPQEAEVSYSSVARHTRINVLRQSIDDCKRTLGDLDAQEDSLRKRLSQIPESKATLRGWMNRATQELALLEGSEPVVDLVNGHSPLEIQSADRVEFPFRPGLIGFENND